MKNLFLDASKCLAEDSSPNIAVYTWLHSNIIAPSYYQLCTALMGTSANAHLTINTSQTCLPKLLIRLPLHVKWKLVVGQLGLWKTYEPMQME